MEIELLFSYLKLGDKEPLCSTSGPWPELCDHSARWCRRPVCSPRCEQFYTHILTRVNAGQLLHAACSWLLKRFKLTRRLIQSTGFPLWAETSERGTLWPSVRWRPSAAGLSWWPGSKLWRFYPRSLWLSYPWENRERRSYLNFLYFH